MEEKRLVIDENHIKCLKLMEQDGYTPAMVGTQTGQMVQRLMNEKLENITGDEITELLHQAVLKATGINDAITLYMIANFLRKTTYPGAIPDVQWYCDFAFEHVVNIIGKAPKELEMNKKVDKYCVLYSSMVRSKK